MIDSTTARGYSHAAGANKGLVAYDFPAYKDHNPVERMFNKLGLLLPISTRHDNTTTLIVPFLALAAEKVFNRA